MHSHNSNVLNSRQARDSLEPLNVPIALNENGLLPISALNAPIPVTFPVWAAAQVGHSYQLLWNSRPIGPIKLVMDSDKPGDILTLEIPASVLIEGKHQIAYLLTNIENGVTVESPSTPVEVDRTAPGQPLLAPILFPPATLDGLTGDELEAMGNVLQGTIASYNGMARFDRIQTFWNGRPGPQAVVDEGDMGLRRVIVDFTRPFLESISDIEAAVHYTVTDLAGNLSMSSAPVRVKLQLAVITPLPGPRVREAVGDVLDPANTANGATVLIDASARLKAGDRVVVSWQGANASDNKEKVITAAEAGLELAQLFSSALVSANKGTTVSVAYAVHRVSGVVQQSATLFLRIVGGQGLAFDTSPATLNGKIYLLPGYPDLLPGFPAGTTLQRVASDGRPPYTYRSSNESVAVVDGNGLASVRGKGVTTISVTDSLGESKSYPLTVSGVIHCLGVGGGKFEQVAAAAASHGARLPSIYELKEIYAAYGNRWPMGNGNYWSATVSHQVLVRWYFLKNLVTGAEFKLSEVGASLGVALR